MAWLSLDPTTLCVIFLIIALSALWMYVSVRNEGIQQPNFSLLHEVAQKTTAVQPKGSKTKVKRKMVCCFGGYQLEMTANAFIKKGGWKP